jgi:hypothetical protein
MIMSMLRLVVIIIALSAWMAFMNVGVATAQNIVVAHRHVRPIVPDGASDETTTTETTEEDENEEVGERIQT